MAIFQKIAASSFAAVRRTMKRRLLMLTLHEALLRDKDLDIEGRERLTDEARELIHEEFNLARDSIGRSEVDRVLADLKYRLVKKLDEEALEWPPTLTAANIGATPTLKKPHRLSWNCICPKSGCALAICSRSSRSSARPRRRSCSTAWASCGGRTRAKRSSCLPPTSARWT
jgi:hypothetical protein